MKKWRIEYSEHYRPGPMSFWVHLPVDGSTWYEAREYDPPLPRAIPCKGFPTLYVTVFGEELRFASPEEVEHFLNTLRQKNLPTSLQLTELRGARYGPNNHWLSRLPAKLKPWRRRERLIPVVERALKEWRDAIGN